MMDYNDQGHPSQINITSSVTSFRSPSQQERKVVFIKDGINHRQVKSVIQQ